MAVTPVVKDRDLAAFIEKAIEKLRTHGWTRRHLGSEETGYCVLGALRAVYVDALEQGVDRAHVGWTHSDAAALIQIRVGRTIAMWNDRSPSPEPILNELEKTVKDLRSGKANRLPQVRRAHGKGVLWSDGTIA